ncbi:uncharacterized protein LOC112603161 [Melanaphis sacchari]|uniref:uncharacterized protein LOC112603161 n=1 Tax=Melanaphis sacchari TaxID=742174 RepID=UPI000DC1457D|nr:uncharacterized protein LOC112603161 [Melanaphis sacchari]
MAIFNDHTVAINLKILKQYGFYQIFDPDSKKVFGWNMYRLSFIALTVIIQCLVGFGNCGFFFELEDTINNIDVFLIIFSSSFNYLNLWKIIILLFNKNNILDLLDVTYLNFFKSKQCHNNVEILYKHRNRTLKCTKLYYNFCTLVIIQWVFYPIIINSFIANKNDNRRLENVINRPYPITVNTYNRYFVLFYIIETVIGIKSVYSLLMIDILLLSIGWAITVQYEVLAAAFKNIRHDVDHQKDHDYNDDNVIDDFKSILFDQQHLNLKVKLYFSIVKPIVLMHVAISLCLIIMLLNSFIMAILSTEPLTITIINLFKIGFGIFYLCLQLFLYCHLFDYINLKKESVNLGIYSCNWTKMDLTFKKILLLTMRINDANQIKMKASEKKIVNLQLFSYVLMTSYNITSVMVKNIS